MKHFIDERIQVKLQDGTFLKKKPRCPQEIHWRSKCIRVEKLESSWCDFSRRGDALRNMRPEHIQRAGSRGSWGVGRYYFEVACDDNRMYVIYYDRAPDNARNRGGKWVLLTYEDLQAGI